MFVLGEKEFKHPVSPKTSWIWVVLYLESIVTMNVLSSRECYWSNEVGRAPDEIGESTRTTWNLGGRVQNFKHSWELTFWKNTTHSVCAESLLSMKSAIQIMDMDGYGGFRKGWYPQIIHFNRIFHSIIKHPAIGVPPRNLHITIGGLWFGNPGKKQKPLGIWHLQSIIRNVTLVAIFNGDDANIYW